MSDWWRDARNEYIEGSLCDEQDRIDWERDRAELLGLEEPKAAPVDSWAVERAAAEALYDGPRWWGRLVEEYPDGAA